MRPYETYLGPKIRKERYKASVIRPSKLKRLSKVYDLATEIKVSQDENDIPAQYRVGLDGLDGCRDSTVYEISLYLSVNL